MQRKFSGMLSAPSSREDRMGMTPAPPGWPLTGRDAELRVLVEALEPGDDGYVGAVILGPAGVGKSRLAGEAASAAGAAGATVRWVVGTESTEGIPLAAFAAWTHEVGDNPMQVVSDIIDTLTSAPGNGGRVVVVIDDAHRLDPLSAFVVHQLVLRRSARVVITMRSGMQPPDLVTALWKDRRLRLLELQPLSRRESDALLEYGLDGPVDAECARRIWEFTRGNVLYLRHLVDQERSAGRLAAADGRWCWAGAPAASAGLTSLIESHVGTVPEPVLDVVDLVVVSEPVDLALLAALVDGAAIEAAERRGLISVTTGVRPAVRIGHPLYGEIRRNQAGQWRMRRLRGRIARALADISDPDIDAVVRTGVMWAESDLPPNPDLSLRAAGAAFQRLDLPLVERLAEPARQDGRVEAAILCAYTYNLMSRADEAEAIFASLDLAALDEDEFCNVTAVRAANCLWPMAKPEMSWRLVDEAWGQSPTSAAVQQTLHAMRSVQLASAARPREAVAVAEQVDIGRLPPVAGLVAVWALVIALGDIGAISPATRVAAEGYARAADSLEATYPGVGLADHHVTALLLAGRIDEAQAIASETRRRCADMPGIANTVATAITGLAALGRGDLPAAQNEMTTAKMVFAQLGEPSTLCYRFSIVTVEVLARLGDLPAATTELATMMRLKHPSFAYLEPDRLLATAWLAAARGTVTSAIAAARSAAAQARGHDQFAREVLALQTAAQFGDKRSAARLRELKDIVEGPRVHAAATLAAGLADSDGDALCEASNLLQEMGDTLAAADASAHAALAYRKRGLRGSALTAAGRAQRLARDGGAVSPALRQAAQPLSLTARECEVIALVLEGLSNRQIADVLSVSVRTVEGHLHRASARTGVSSREQLAILLRDFEGR
jgi:DNA-binding CsgD family transcriptional regulator